MKKKFIKQKFYAPGLVAAAGLFAYAAYMGAPHDALVRANMMLANATVGASAAVAPNPYNTLAQQLSDKENQLDAREKALAAQNTVQSQSLLLSQSNMPLYSFIMSLILAILVAVNFFFDWKRGRIAGNPFMPQTTINLRRRG